MAQVASISHKDPAIIALLILVPAVGSDVNNSSQHIYASQIGVGVLYGNM